MYYSRPKSRKKKQSLDEASLTTMTMTIMHTSEPLVAVLAVLRVCHTLFFCRFVCANTWNCGEAATFDRRFHAEVDPELLNTFEKLGIPLTEQKAGAE